MRNPLRTKKGQAILRTLKLGDAVHAVARPVAVALRLSCIDPKTNQLRPESGCAKRRTKLNGHS